MRLSAIACVAIFLATMPALARENGDSDQREAHEHYENGLARYHVGEFDAAIEEFKAAYALTRAPRLLFDIAQAQRLKKDYQQALYSYETYLRLLPGAPNREDVSARIVEMKQLLAASPPSPAPVVVPEPTPAPVVVEPTPAPVVVVQTPPPPPQRRTRLWAGIGIAAGGVVLLAAAAGCTGVAAGDGSELDRLSSSGGMWSGHYQDLYDQGRRDQAAAAALWTIGGVAVVVGGVLAILGARERKR